MKLIQYQLGATYKKAQKQIGYILKRYHKYKKLWNKQFGERLVDHILWDYAVDLKPGMSPRFFLIYKLIEVKQQVLRDFV